jgi:hypothetical protein
MTLWRSVSGSREAYGFPLAWSHAFGSVVGEQGLSVPEPNACGARLLPRGRCAKGPEVPQGGTVFRLLLCSAYCESQHRMVGVLRGWSTAHEGRPL